MAFIDFDDKYKVGHPAIDQQHAEPRVFARSPRNGSLRHCDGHGQGISIRVQYLVSVETRSTKSMNVTGFKR